MNNPKEGYIPLLAYSELLKAIKKRTQEKGINTNYRLSKLSGVPLTTIDRLMAGEAEVKLSTLMDVCRVLDIQLLLKFN